MKTKIVDGIEAARDLEDTVVVIDVLRASNTIIAAMAKGAERIYVADSEDKAHELLKKHPGCLYFAEHMGDKLPDADYTNSPSEAYNQDLDGKSIVLLTTMGSRAIAAPKNAREILVASFGNAAAVAAYLKKTQPLAVNFVACGEIGDVRALEDYECACYIAALAHGKTLDFGPVIQNVAYNSNGVKRLVAKHQDDDLAFCLKPDFSSVIPYASLVEGSVVIRKF